VLASRTVKGPADEAFDRAECVRVIYRSSLRIVSPGRLSYGVEYGNRSSGPVFVVLGTCKTRVH
jgi:hypothetical protein